MSKTTRQRLLREAVRLAGVEAVGAQLQASAEAVDLWLRGLATMPDRKLLALADLLDRLGSGEIRRE